LWLYPGEWGAWHFVTVPQKVSAEIKAKHGKAARGWGSLRVTAVVGKASWDTSIFPDRKRGAYLLPVKADVRKKAGVRAGDVVRVGLALRV
jgi:hypothetical protein